MALTLTPLLLQAGAAGDVFVLVASSWLRCGTGVRFSELCIAAPPFESKGLCVLSCLDSFRCRFSEVQCSAGNGGAISNTERAKAKVVTYGIVYGSGPAGEPTAEMLPPARSSWWHLAGCSDAVAEIHSPQCSTAWQCCDFGTDVHDMYKCFCRQMFYMET